MEALGTFVLFCTMSLVTIVVVRSESNFQEDVSERSSTFQSSTSSSVQEQSLSHVEHRLSFVNKEDSYGQDLSLKDQETSLFNKQESSAFTEQESLINKHKESSSFEQHQATLQKKQQLSSYINRVHKGQSDTSISSENISSDVGTALPNTQSNYQISKINKGKSIEFSEITNTASSLANAQTSVINKKEEQRTYDDGSVTTEAVESDAQTFAATATQASTKVREENITDPQNNNDQSSIKISEITNTASSLANARSSLMNKQLEQRTDSEGSVTTEAVKSVAQSIATAASQASTKMRQENIIDKQNNNVQSTTTTATASSTSSSNSQDISPSYQFNQLNTGKDVIVSKTEPRKLTASSQSDVVGSSDSPDMYMLYFVPDKTVVKQPTTTRSTTAAAASTAKATTVNLQDYQKKATTATASSASATSQTIVVSTQMKPLNPPPYPKSLPLHPTYPQARSIPQSSPKKPTYSQPFPDYVWFGELPRSHDKIYYVDDKTVKEPDFDCVFYDFITKKNDRGKQENFNVKLLSYDDDKNEQCQCTCGNNKKPYYFTADLDKIKNLQRR